MSGEVDDALSAVESGENDYWIAETLALEVRCNRTTIARLQAEVARLRLEIDIMEIGS